MLSRIPRALLAVLAFAAFAPAAQAFSFRADVAFPFGDNNVLCDAGECRYRSPTAYFGQDPSAVFKRLGSSNFGMGGLHLNLYAALDGLSEMFVPEAALVMLFRHEPDGSYRIKDDGSYLALNLFFDASRKRRLALELFPVDADRMAAGFHYETYWGTTDAFPAHFRNGLAPGGRLAFDWDFIWTWIGVKTALVRSPSEDILDNPGGNTNKMVERTAVGVLGGLGGRIPIGDGMGITIETNGGYFRKGNNTRANVLGKPIHAAGVSGQLGFALGSKIGRRIDLGLYLDDPVRNPVDAKETRTDPFAMHVQVEGSGIMQILEDPDHVASTEPEWAWAAFAEAAFKVYGLRFHANFLARSLPFITFNVPGFVPYQALPDDADVTPEMYLLFNIDYLFEGPRLTPYLQAGVLWPATYEGRVPAGFDAAAIQEGIRTVVVRGAYAGAWDILPAGESASPVFYARAGLRWQFSRFTALAEMTYGRDPNYSQVLLDARGHAMRKFDDPNVLSFGLLAKMSF